MNYVCLSKSCPESNIVKEGAPEPLGDVLCGACGSLLTETTDDPTSQEVTNADPAN